MLHPTHVTVEHLPNSLTVDIGQAPRNMTLWGVVDGRINKEVFERLVLSESSSHARRTPTIVRDLLWAPLISFTYDIEDDNSMQTFPINPAIVDNRMSFGVVALEILDNWGSETTCLYRVRVHGDPAR